MFNVLYVSSLLCCNVQGALSSAELGLSRMPAELYLHPRLFSTLEHLTLVYKALLLSMKHYVPVQVTTDTASAYVVVMCQL